MSRRHAAWCADYVARIGSMLRSSAEVEGVARLTEVWENVRVAVGWACTVEDLDLAATLTKPVIMELTSRSRIEIGDWVERMLDVPSAASHELRALMLHVAALRSRWTSDRVGFERLIERHSGVDHPSIRWERANLDYDWEGVVSLGPTLVADAPGPGSRTARQD